MLTATQELVLEALCDAYVYDIEQKRGSAYLRPRRVAVAAGVSYDVARRALAKLHELGLIDKLTDEDEWITTELYYSPNWSRERGTGNPWLNEWEREMGTRSQYLHTRPVWNRLQRDDEEQRRKQRKW